MARKKLPPLEKAKKSLPQAPAIRCHSDDDGYCEWKNCPQLRDGEPKATGRSCPHYPQADEDYFGY